MSGASGYKEYNGLGKRKWFMYHQQKFLSKRFNKNSGILMS